MNSRAIGIVLMLSLLTLPTMAQTDLPGIASITNDAWPPFINADGHSGLALDIVTTALQTQGVSLQVTIKPWARAMKDVIDGKNDLLLATWESTARTQTLLFSQPYLKNRLRFIKRADDPFEYRDLASLSGKRIGVIRDYSYTGEFASSNNFTREPHQDLQANLRMLAAKRLDLTLEDEIVASYCFYQLQLADHYHFTGPPLTVKRLYLAAGIQNPKSKALIAAFNQGLKLIMDDGRYEQILASYGAMLHSNQMPEIIRPTNPAAQHLSIMPSPMYVSTGWPASHLNTPWWHHPGVLSRHNQD